MASFQAKTGWDKLKVREKNFLVPIQSNPTRNREFQKNSKKMQKIKKTLLWLYFDLERDGTGWDCVKKKNYRSNPINPDPE